MGLFLRSVLAAVVCISLASSTPLESRDDGGGRCRRAKVAVLGAGAAGITAAHTLNQKDVKNFVIVEASDAIGGRVRHAEFGKGPNGKPYMVELGANWIQGLGSEEGPENPVWTYSKRYGVNASYTDLSSVETFTDKGKVDYYSRVEDYENAYGPLEQYGGRIIKESLPDPQYSAGLEAAGWNRGDPISNVVEWYQCDFEYARRPEYLSHAFTVANYNATFYGFSEENNLVTDQDGYNKWIRGLASEFLRKNDPRLMLNTEVKSISYSDRGVTIRNADGSCIEAEYAINTFSLGVLQSGSVQFSPQLPKWKKAAIDSFGMGIFTKIFLQFPPEKVFWNKSVEYFLYASPKERGYYPIFRSIDHPNHLSGSGILFGVVTTEQSQVIENQNPEETKAQALAVLREMFGAKKVPDPIDFRVTDWSKRPWTRGSYSYWPVGVTLKEHQNLRANTGRLWFAGEATSAEYYGYLQGAYYEGKVVAEAIAKCVGPGEGRKAGKPNCRQQRRYEAEVEQISRYEDFNPENGWFRYSYDIEEYS